MFELSLYINKINIELIMQSDLDRKMKYSVS